MKDRYMRDLAWVSFVLVVLGAAVWLFGDWYYSAGYGSTLVWWVFVYGGVFLIAIGVAEWAYLSKKARLL